jgi:hypothetical protein
VLASLLVTLLALAPAPVQDDAARTLALLRTPERALEVAGDDKREQHMLPLLRAYADLLGWQLVLEPELEQALAQLETGLDSPAGIAREDVHPLVQNIVRAHNLCFRLEPQAEHPQLHVESAASEQLPKAFASPIAILPALLPAWSNHPAFILSVELAHAPDGSEELCARLRALCAKSTSRVEISRADSGALRFTASSAILEFIVEALLDGQKFAEPLESATFPADPNTPAGKAAAVLPARLRSAFPTKDAPLTLRTDAALPRDLDVVRAYSRWSARPLLFLSTYTRGALWTALGAPDTPESVPPAWAHEFVSGLLADAGLPLAPLPARHPVLWTIEQHAPLEEVGLDLAGVPAIRLDELAAVAHLAATRFEAFVRLPKPDADLLRKIGELESPDARAPFWITQLDDPQLFSVIGTPRAITSAVLALKLLTAPPKPR